MKGSDGHGRIARWQDRLGDCDFIICHRPSKDPMLRLADRLSLMPTRLTAVPTAEDTERLAMQAFETSDVDSETKEENKWELRTRPCVPDWIRVSNLGSRFAVAILT